MGNALAVLRTAGLKALQDTDQWVHRFEIRSESSDRLYVVAKRRTTGEWGCSCMGWKRTRNCKHLRAVSPVTRQIDAVDGIGPAIGHRPAPTAAAAPGALAVARRQPKSEAARAAAKERARASFSDAAYAKYDAAGGFGSPEEWVRLAAGMFDRVEVHAGDQALSSGGKRMTGRREAMLAVLGADWMPDSLAELKKVARRKMRLVHPDVGGSADEFRKVFAAYERLALDLFGARV